MTEKELSFKDILNNVTRMARRRRWWLLIPAALVTLGTIAVALWLPNRYESEAVLVFVPQDVASRFSEPTSPLPVADQVESMKRQILSRTQLLGIIHDLELYPKLTSKVSDEDLADRMRHDVTIKSTESMSGKEDTNAFAVTFAAETPTLAKAVTTRLTSLFIEEDEKERGQQVTRTNDFLGDQVQTAKNKLATQEARLEQFKRQNLSELPEQQSSNMGILTDLRLQLQNASNNLTRARQERSSLESQLAGKVAGLNTERALLLTRYTAKHFEVIKKDQEIAKTQAMLESVRAGAPVAADPGDAVTGTLVNQASANKVEVENLSREIQRLNAEIGQYQVRMNNSPVRESQYSQLNRDYEIYKKDYEDLVNKKMQSEMSVSIQTRREGQRFRLIDPPTMPTHVASPQRLRMSLIGLISGLFLGLAIAFIVDTRDHTFHSEGSLKERFSLPLVVGIPSVTTPQEEHSRSVRYGLEWTAATVMALVVLASEYYVYRHG